MAVPKRKTSKQRKNTRSSANNNMVAPTLCECSHCHEQKPSHEVCPKCGYYNGRQIIELKKEKKK